MSGAVIPVELWPYLTIVLAGFLPTEIWRWLAGLAARDLKEDSPFLHWVRLVATALLMAVVAKLLLHPTGALASVPLWGRLSAVLGGIAVLFATRRSVISAVLTGEVILISAGMLAR